VQAVHAGEFFISVSLFVDDQCLREIDFHVHGTAGGEESAAGKGQ
jgi:hypothetical protein